MEPLNFDLFKKYHSEVIMFYQRIERDLKYIFCQMAEGDFDEIFYDIKNETLGSIVRQLENLDKKDDNRWISDEDYAFLKDVARRRNYWAHQNYLDFIYLGNDFLYSKEYAKQSSKLINDHDRMLVVANNIEKLRLNVCADL